MSSLTRSSHLRSRPGSSPSRHAAAIPDRRPATSTPSPKLPVAVDPLTVPPVFGDPNANDVVDRRELSLVGLSHMRLDGCRTHRYHTPAGPSLSYVGLPGSSTVLLKGTMPQQVQRASTAATPSAPPPPPPPPRPAGPTRSQRADLSTKRLETSMRILERMAQDTAASVYGGAVPHPNGRASPSPGSTPPHVSLRNVGHPAAPVSPLRFTTMYTTPDPQFGAASSPANFASSSGRADDAMGERTARYAVSGSMEAPGPRPCSTAASTELGSPSAVASTMNGFARTTFGEYSLDNLASATTATSTATGHSNRTVEGNGRDSSSPSAMSKQSTSVSISATDEHLGMPSILVHSRAHRRPPAATASKDADSSDEDECSFPRGGHFSTDASFIANATTLPPCRSRSAKSPTRVPPATLSVSELVLGHQLTLQAATSSTTTAPFYASITSGITATGTTQATSGGRTQGAIEAPDAGSGGAHQLHDSNHDLQRILSQEDKDALTIGVQPYEEVDEDAEVDPLDIRARSRQRSQQEAQMARKPAPEASARGSTWQRALPALQPCGAGEVNGRGGGAGSLETPTPLWRPAIRIPESGGSANGEGGEPSTPAALQPFQTWRFPLLGRGDSPLCSPEVDDKGGLGGFARGSQTSSNPSPGAADGGARRDSRAGWSDCDALTGATTPSILGSRRPTVTTAEGDGGAPRVAAGATHQHVAPSLRRDSWSCVGPLGRQSNASENPFTVSRTGTLRRESDSSRWTTSSSTTPTRTVSEPDATRLPPKRRAGKGERTDSTTTATSGHTNSAEATSSLPSDHKATEPVSEHTYPNAVRMLQTNAAAPEFVRRLEMVYAAYGKVVRDAGGGADAGDVLGFSVATTALSPPSSLAVTPSAAQRARRISFSLTGPQSCLELPFTNTTASAHATANTAAATPQRRISATTNNLNVSPHTAGSLRHPSAAVTPATSISGGLGRSAGYYSFGNRLSLHHPNRQSVPSTPQELQSISHLPAGVRSVGTRSPSMEALGRKARLSGTVMQADGLPARRRHMDAAVLEVIATRPLLQSTVFLYYAQEQIREAHEGRKNGSGEGSSGTGNAIVERLSAAARRSADHGVVRPTPFKEHKEGRAADGDAGAFDAPSTRTSRALPDTHTPGQSLMYSNGPVSMSNQPDASLSHMRSAKLPFSPPSTSRAGSLASASAVGLGGAGDAGVHGSDCSQSGMSAETAAASEAMAHGDDPLAASHLPPSQHQVTEPRPAQGQGSEAGYTHPPPPPCYRRALTPFTELVRHVHPIDGYEREVDNENNDLVVYTGMRLMGWLEVVSLLGRGTFGQVFLCKDLRISDGHFVHPSEIEGEDFSYWDCCHAYLPFGDSDIPPTHPPLVAVKVVKSVPLFEQQSVLEAEMLVLVGAQTIHTGDVAAASAGTQMPVTEAASGLETSTGIPVSVAPDPPLPDPRCAHVGKILADGVCYGHHCIVMERYGANIYEYIESIGHVGLPMYQIRSIGRQLLSALTLVHEDCHIIHTDIKPENMLLTLDSCRSVMPGNQLQQPPPALVPTAVLTAHHQPGDAADSRTTRAPSSEPPRRQTRREDGALEASCIRLSAGVSADTGVGATRTTTVFLDAGDAPGSSIVLKGGAAGQGSHHVALRSSSQPSLNPGTAVASQGSTTGATVVAPEPQRVHALDQSRPSLASAGVAGAVQLGTSTRSFSPASVSLQATGPIPSPVPRLHVKLIDFSSSCYDAGPFYSYIQSRYYRAPEVLVSAPYGAAIDLWSTGCVLAELFVGVPLLPGVSDHNQLALIHEMIGPLPDGLLREGAATGSYYDEAQQNEGAGAATSGYTLISNEEYSRRHQIPVEVSPKLFKYSTLQEVIRHCPLAIEERRMSNGEYPYPSTAFGAAAASATADTSTNGALIAAIRGELMKQRFLFFDLLVQLLNPDPTKRLTATAALAHPFFSTTPSYIQHFSLE